MSDLNWFVVTQALRIQFRDVHWITTAELADWLNDAQRPRPIMLDVRTRAEWEVSHLSGARWAEPNADPASALVPVPKNAPVVTYCSVGYRSAKAARRLQAEGYTHVQNLEGSIFAWANEGRPLVHSDYVVRQVHPYDQFWGRLLDPDHRASLRQSP
jgi:rhodanese-related sulfurtransferase